MPPLTMIYDDITCINQMVSRKLVPSLLLNNTHGIDIFQCWASCTCNLVHPQNPGREQAGVHRVSQRIQGTHRLSCPRQCGISWSFLGPKKITDPKKGIPTIPPVIYRHGDDCRPIWVHGFQSVKNDRDPSGRFPCKVGLSPV